MAKTYGVVNLITSFGFAARWRRQCVESLPSVPTLHVADLMSGMGELWRSIARRIPRILQLTAVDISSEMTRRASTIWPFKLDVQIRDVLTWELPRGSQDAIVSSFGLKTFNREQQARLASQVAELLRPGGAFSFVEISVPSAVVLRVPYMFYLQYIIPFLGRMFLGNPDNYRMLSIYTRAFGNCDYFAQCLSSEGLEVSVSSYFYGCATGVQGIKPEAVH